MWRRTDAKPSYSPAEPPAPAPSMPPVAAERPAATAPSEPRREGTVISRTVSIKGEIHGSEPLYLDGEFEGTIVLEGADLTVGANGNVSAEVDARHVVIEGHVQGKVRARERLLVRRSGNFAGEALVKRVAIEEGATFDGRVDMGQSAESVAAARAAASSGADSYAATPYVAKSEG